MTIHKICTEQDLFALMQRYAVQRKCKKVRVFETGKSYEDYSISYTLAGMPVFNFTVKVSDGFVVISKRAKHSKKHVKFAVGTSVFIEYTKKHVPYVTFDVVGRVEYTDGTHRYEK
jgi:hypothetical protein